MVEVLGIIRKTAIMNHYFNILHSARENKWCTTMYCTTCGATEFRTALRKLGDGISEELARLDLSAFEALRNWDDILRLTLDEIRRAELMDKILLAWLPQIDQHIRLADVILYYYVRSGAINAPMSVKVLQQWREKCVELAVGSRDESLVESLICTLDDYKKYPDLDAVVQDLEARGSRRITVALRRQN